MPHDAEDTDTLIRNIRLSASWPVLLVFGVNPLVACCYLWYSVSNLTDSGFISRRSQVALPIVYLILSTSLIPFATKAYVEERLRRLGYEQRRSTPAEIDWVLNLGLCFGYMYWMSKQDFEGRDGWQVILLTVLHGLSLWIGMTLALLGPIWWFTKRVRQ